MNQGQTILSQVIDFLPKKKFSQCVNEDGTWEDGTWGEDGNGTWGRAKLYY